MSLSEPNCLVAAAADHVHEAGLGKSVENPPHTRGMKLGSLRHNGARERLGRGGQNP